MAIELRNVASDVIEVKFICKLVGGVGTNKCAIPVETADAAKYKLDLSSASKFAWD
jgi:hypothetical protein